jgi:hypothetical protein
MTTDVAAAKAFYGSLFGWSFEDRPVPMGGFYSMAFVDGDSVAAIAPQPPMVAETKAPAAWSTYLAVDNVDDAVNAAGANGGSVLMSAEDIEEAGRMAFVADPTGAVVGLWQARGHIGATRVNEPNTLVWNELTTSDVAAAVPFYKAVAGIDAVPMQMGDMEYTMLKVDGDDVGGATIPQMDGVPNHWHTWFAVTDAAATASAVTVAGGTILAGPMDIPVGTAVTIRDPQGAVFSVLQPAEQS